MVYVLRLKLQSIWQQAKHNQKLAQNALAEWSKQAEASGIESLLKFVHYLNADGLRSC